MGELATTPRGAMPVGQKRKCKLTFFFSSLLLAFSVFLIRDAVTRLFSWSESGGLICWRFTLGRRAIEKSRSHRRLPSADFACLCLYAALPCRRLTVAVCVCDGDLLGAPATRTRIDPTSWCLRSVQVGRRTQRGCVVRRQGGRAANSVSVRLTGMGLRLVSEVARWSRLSFFISTLLEAAREAAGVNARCRLRCGNVSAAWFLFGNRVENGVCLAVWLCGCISVSLLPIRFSRECGRRYAGTGYLMRRGGGLRQRLKMAREDSRVSERVASRRQARNERSEVSSRGGESKAR